MLRLTALIAGLLLIFTQVSIADTVVLRNGDLFQGKVQNQDFEIRAPFGAVTIRNGMVKGLFMRSSEMDNDEIQTINNDYFSGKLRTETISFRTTAGYTLDFQPAEIRNVQFDGTGVSREYDTALLFMHNGDKFSGRPVATDLRLNTAYEEKTIRMDTLARLDLVAPGQHAATVHLNDGSRFAGVLMEARLQVKTDSLGVISVCVSKLKRVQFNVKKLIVRQAASIRGILDSDSDGTPDTRDECPDTACGFMTDDVGCRLQSDTDKDGVDDSLDQCAGTPIGAQTDTNGCWVIQAALFELNKADISPESHSYLDEVVWILERNPDLKVEIQGHADKSGSAAYNLKLTQARAKSVAAYIVSKGIAKDRLKAVGYGFSQPKATNDTEEGRALNRRVELVPIR